MARYRDPIIMGQEYDLDMTDGTVLLIKVIRSQVNDGYSLTIKDSVTERSVNFEEMCEENLGMIPVIYSQDDVNDILGKLFDESVGIGDTVPEWESARPLETIAEYGHLSAAHEEILSGVFVESHAVSGASMYLRFGNIIMKCDPRWID